METIETRVLPIEYDDNTEVKAKEIKNILERNPNFFKAFLPWDHIISCIDKENPLYIGEEDSILNHLDISASDANLILTNQLTSSKEDRKLILAYLLDQKYNEQEEKDDIEDKEIKLSAAIAYYDNDYQQLHSYLIESKEEKDEEILAWLNDNYRFELLDFLIENQSTYQIEDNKLEEIEDMIDITLDEMDVLEEKGEYQTISYPMTKEETYHITKEFLATIDPTLSWLELFTQAEKEHKFIEELDTWQTFEIEDEQYINTPLTNTLEDPISLVHTFIDYISCIKTNTKTKDYKIGKLPSIFFENLMCQFLIQKGYPKEEINKYQQNRLLRVVEHCEEIEDILYYMEIKAKGNPITLEEGKKLYNNENLNDTSLTQLAVEICDVTINNLLWFKDMIPEVYPYILGKRYADILTDEYVTNKDILPQMINLTETLKEKTTKEVLNKTISKTK